MGQEFKMEIDLGCYTTKDALLVDNINIFPNKSWELLVKPKLVDPLSSHLFSQPILDLPYRHIGECGSKY